MKLQSTILVVAFLIFAPILIDPGYASSIFKFSTDHEKVGIHNLSQDPCDIDPCDSSCNTYPILSLPADVDTCLPPGQTLCIRDILSNDADFGDTIWLEKIEGPGIFVPDTAIMPGNIIDSVCFAPATFDSTYTFIFKLTDQCADYVMDTFSVAVDINVSPCLTLPPDADTCLTEAKTLCIKK